MDAKLLQSRLLELIRRTSCELPPDVKRAVDKGWRKEKTGTTAKYAFSVIRDNVILANDKSQPICQDTGTIICYVDRPLWISETDFRKAFEKAVVQATKVGYLRQNSVDSITGKNSGTNLGPGSPTIHFHETKAKTMTIRMMLKGGGCENVGIQYALPNTQLGAGRDLEGVRRCVLDAVNKAQGKGCAPGALGVCIGGDRATGFANSKEQLLRTLDDKNDDKALAALEARVMKKANQLGIGPMGFGGKTTLLGCKIGMLNRLPASYFVSISYMCWAFRRRGCLINATGKATRWMYT